MTRSEFSKLNPPKVCSLCLRESPTHGVLIVSRGANTIKYWLSLVLFGLMGFLFYLLSKSSITLSLQIAIAVIVSLCVLLGFGYLSYFIESLLVSRGILFHIDLPLCVKHHRRLKHVLIFHSCFGIASFLVIVALLVLVILAPKAADSVKNGPIEAFMGVVLGSFLLYDLFLREALSRFYWPVKKFRRKGWFRVSVRIEFTNDEYEHLLVSGGVP